MIANLKTRWVEGDLVFFNGATGVTIFTIKK